MSNSCQCEKPWDIKGMCGICGEFIPDEDNTVPIPTPVGKFIMDQTDLDFVESTNGYYYHYSDVCTLLNRYRKNVIDELNKNWRETIL